MIQPIEIRKSILQMCYASGEGHIPSCFSVVEILIELYENRLKYRIENPYWEDRDYFILSKGHASAALYAVLGKIGFISEKELLSFAKYDSPLGGHPDRNKVPGVESSSGSLGHGFPFAAGIALGLKIKAKPNKVYVLIGDGESNEGSIWETAMVAAHRKLNNLIGILDANQSQTRCLPLTNIAEKWAAFGWNTHEVDGHNLQDLRETFKSISSKETSCPIMIIAHTVKGKGSRLLENDSLAWHHRSPTEEEFNIIMRELE
jgi:transketolase